MAHALFLFLSKWVIDCGEVLWNEKNVYLCSRFQGSVLRLPVSPVL